MTTTATKPLPRRAWERIRPLIAAPVRLARRTLERVLRPSRRRSALARLHHLGTLQEIHVLCYGNICRSPYAAAALERALAGTGIRVRQGGFYGPDRPANRMAMEVAAARGVDLANHRSRLVDAEDARRASLMIVMEPGQAIRLRRDFQVPSERILVLGDLEPDASEPRIIHDPYGHPAPVFLHAYDRIDRCLAELVRHLPPAD